MPPRISSTDSPPTDNGAGHSPDSPPDLGVKPLNPVQGESPGAGPRGVPCAREAHAGHADTQAGDSYRADWQRRTMAAANRVGLTPTPESITEQRGLLTNSVTGELDYAREVGALEAILRLAVEAYADGDDVSVRRVLTTGLALLEASA